MIKEVIKRDGRRVPFNVGKITTAIMRAAEASGGKDEELAKRLSFEVCDLLDEQYGGKGKGKAIPSVSDIQNCIEKVLIEAGHAKTAKTFILYRAERDRIREAQSDLMKTIGDLTEKDSKDLDNKRENANINADTAMGAMLKFGSESAKAYNLANLITKEYSEAHKVGDIHIHDLDFLSLTETCCQIDLTKLFTGGFSTGHGYLREPNDIKSYAALACIAIQSNQNDQHGGQSVPKFDFDMAKGVAKTFIKEFKRNLKTYVTWQDILQGVVTEEEINNRTEELGEQLKDYISKHNGHIMTEEGYTYIREQIERYFIELDMSDEVFEKLIAQTEKQVDKETHQAMEALVHNLNTMQCRAGAQVPFSSINLGTDISQEGRLVTKNLLLAMDEGMGNGETPIFPIVIFKVKDGVNYEEGTPNRDLLELGLKVTAKRMFPNFSFIDASFNKPYYKEGRPETEIAYMGCAIGESLVQLKIDDIKTYLISLSKAYKLLSERYSDAVKDTGVTTYVDLTDKDVKIYDTASGGFVKCKKILKNPNRDNWFEVKAKGGRVLYLTADHPLKTDRGRVLVKDMNTEDYIYCVNKPYVRDNSAQEFEYVDADLEWLYGFLLCSSCYDSGVVFSVTKEEQNVINKVKRIVEKMGYSLKVRKKKIKGSKNSEVYICSIRCGTQLKHFTKELEDMFGGKQKRYRGLPTDILSWDNDSRCAFLAGMLDANGRVNVVNGKTTLILGAQNKELAYGQMYLAQSLGYAATINSVALKNGKVRLQVFIYPNTMNLQSYLSNLKVDFSTIAYHKNVEKLKVASIKPISITECSYDVETESDMFDLCGVQSHNCRTRVIGNTYDSEKEIVTGRGNLSFTSVNLPRLAIESEGSISTFYAKLDEKIDLVINQLLERFEIQCRKHVYNYPFLMGQGVWIGSEKLKYNDSVAEVLRHGTLSMGFIGLAECLVALIGKHHGESVEAQKLGLDIVSHMRKRMDEASEQYKLNFSLLATPELKRALI